MRFALPATALLLLAGCGGSSHPAAGTQAAVSTTSLSTSSPTTTARTTSRTSHATSVTTAASSTTHQSASQSSGGNGNGSGGAGLGPGSSSPGGGAINARVPAIFTLRANGSLSPAQVSAPAFLAVAVRINSAASTAHSVTIATPKPVHLQVRPHHAATAKIPGLRAGTYQIQIDGRRRGALVIGGEPGP